MIFSVEFVIYKSTNVCDVGMGNTRQFRDQGPVVRKAINANPRLQINQGFEFSCIKVFFTVNVLYSF